MSRFMASASVRAGARPRSRLRRWAALSRVVVLDACPAGAYFLCLAKESRQRKSRLRRRPCGVPCAARLAVAPRNSLRELRSLRSDRRGEMEEEARYARRPQDCAARRLRRQLALAANGQQNKTQLVLFLCSPRDAVGAF